MADITPHANDVHDRVPKLHSHACLFVCCLFVCLFVCWFVLFCFVCLFVCLFEALYLGVSRIRVPSSV